MRRIPLALLPAALAVPCVAYAQVPNRASDVQAPGSQPPALGAAAPPAGSSQPATVSLQPAPLPADNQVNALDEVVVTATRVPTLAERIPAGVSVVDRATIEARGYTTLTEALSAIPGLRVVQSGPQGQVASVFIRGTNSNHVLVLRDGLQVNDPSDPGNAFNFGVDTLEDLERIEVIRGPASGIYGSGAIGGVINLVTRKGEGPTRFVVEGAGGYPRTVLGRAAASGSAGRWDYSLSAESRSDVGFDVTPRRLRTVYTGERDGFRTQLGTLNLGFTPVDGTRLSVLLRARTTKFGYDSVGTFDDPNLTGLDENLYGRVGGTSELFGGRWQTSLFLGRNQTDRRFTNLLDAGDPSQASGRSTYQGRRSDVQWNNTVRLPDTPATSEGAVTFGYQHINDVARVSVDTRSFGFPFRQSLAAHADTDAGYVGAQALFLRKLTLTAQGREEATTLANDRFTWRVGGVLAVPEAWSRIKLAYGTAFRAPALFDRYGVDSFGYRGNPALRPERSQGYEAGVSTDLPLAGRPDWATVSVTYFDNQIRDLIQAVFSPVSTSVNIARASARGIETAVTLRPLRWLEADISYTYTDTRDRSTGARLLRRPLNAASLNVRATPLPGLTIAPELTYTGEFQDFITADNGQSLGIGRARSGLVANLNVTYQVIPSLALFAYAKNLGGSRFEPANGFQIGGTSVLVGTRVRF